MDEDFIFFTKGTHAFVTYIIEKVICFMWISTEIVMSFKTALTVILFITFCNHDIKDKTINK